MNFVEYFKMGKLGKNIGLPTGLSVLDKAINGIQKRSIIGIAAPPKVGKSKLTDAHFILYPYILAPNADIEWIYFSYEMDRVQKEFAFAVFFLNYYYKIGFYKWKAKTEELTTDYLMGRLKDNSNEPILVSNDIEEKLKEVYVKYIIPLFGEFDEKGKQIKRGKIDFIEAKYTANEMNNYVVNHAKQCGTFITNVNGKFSGYIPNNPNKFTIIITDTLRKIKRDKGQTTKDALDSWISYSVQFRNMCMFTFVHIIHCNRALSDIDRLQYMKEFIHPTGDDVKESGNLSEEADYMLTLFNPNDEKYGIKKHFGLDLFDQQNNLLYPNYRSLHLVESRHTICPMHMQLELVGNIGYYRNLGENTYSI